MSRSLRSTTASPALDVPDGELIERVRSGERSAYGMLFERHAPAARRFARSLGATDADADDVVAEVFASVLCALERGKGPTGSFAPYLMSSVRHECYRSSRRSSRESTNPFGAVVPGAARDRHDPYAGLDEAAVVRVAFRSLPDPLREVLWRTEIDELSPTEVADGSGGSPQAVAMMAMRARRALGSAYLHQHLVTEREHVEISSACRDARPHIANFIRGALTERRRLRLQQHLDECPACDEAHRGLGRLNRHLKAVPPLPLHVGWLASGTLGVKVQAVAWLSAEALPVAKACMVAVTVFSPVLQPPPAPVAQAAPPTASTTLVLEEGSASAIGGGRAVDDGRAAVGVDEGRAVDDVDEVILAAPITRWVSRPPTESRALEGTVSAPPTGPAGTAPLDGASTPVGPADSQEGPGSGTHAIPDRPGGIAAVPGVVLPQPNDPTERPSAEAETVGDAGRVESQSPAPEPANTGAPAGPVHEAARAGGAGPVPAPTRNDVDTAGESRVPGQAPSTGSASGNASSSEPGPGQAANTATAKADTGARDQAGNGGRDNGNGNGNGNQAASRHARNDADTATPGQARNATAANDTEAPAQAGNNGSGNGNGRATGQAKRHANALASGRAPTNGNGNTTGKATAPGQARNRANESASGRAPSNDDDDGNGLGTGLTAAAVTLPPVVAPPAADAPRGVDGPPPVDAPNPSCCDRRGQLG